MLELEVRIDDHGLRDRLRRMPRRIDDALRAGMEDATALVLRDMVTYPQQRPGSAYRRTGTLRRSWSRVIKNSGLGIEGIVGSNPNVAPYNRYVQDELVQAYVHRPRWTNTAQRVLRRRADGIQDMFDRRIARAIDGR